MEVLVAEEQFAEAFALAERAEHYIGGDSVLSELLLSMSQYISISTSPSNADVYFKELADTGGAWKPLGQSPIDSVRLPLGYKRWRVEKAGFVTVESFSAAAPAVDFRLEEEGTAPPNMIRIPAKGLRVSLHGFPAYTERIEAPDYWIDKHEVTNREFKVFIDSGGYENRDYWKHDFEDGGRALSWEHAMMEFHDRTGRPGPSTWEGGTYPAGQDNYPVSGVSWYEAAAYAEFAGKSLPTIYHWLGATDINAAAQILPYSNIDNIEGDGPTPVRAYQPGSFGLYDMAGNVREWVWNRSGSSRYVLGGAWNEPVYMFYEADVRSAFDRSPGNGFRGVQYPGGQAQLAEAFTRPVEFAEFAALDRRAIEPASDELFEAYRSQYSYDPTPLEPVTEALDESPTYWRKEKVSFNAAYGGERVTVYLFLPANIEPPYQAVVYWPYSGAILQPSSDNLSYLSAFDFVIKSGRAVVYPVYKGSYERNPGVTTWVPNTSRFYADHIIQAVQDLMRSVDYLESRADIDAESIAYYGTSWGAFIGPIPLALETRFKAGILVAGGFVPMEARPEVTEFNFAPRVKAPILMINGRYDYLFPLESNQEPMFDLLGTPEEHKRHILYEAGHSVLAYRINQIKENILEWLDRYLGMVN
ncbi:MAG: SUMF1/EgtB/PvdO family nonheme iron enzyme [Gemmatimonadetes bacterium]|nr:SUMF1/EgtB/PvdO family nonheme iron enzyme [Gemmatimonadota bacterium]